MCGDEAEEERDDGGKGGDEQGLEAEEGEVGGHEGAAHAARVELAEGGGGAEARGEAHFAGVSKSIKRAVASERGFRARGQCLRLEPLGSAALCSRLLDALVANSQITLQVPDHGDEDEQLVDAPKHAPSSTVFQQLAAEHQPNQ